MSIGITDADKDHTLRTKRVKKQHNPSSTSIKRTTRQIRSCITCKKRKVKCNFEVPCDRCIFRNEAATCTRESVIVNGYLVNNNDTKELKFSQENEVLKQKIKELQNIVTQLKSKLAVADYPKQDMLNVPTTPKTPLFISPPTRNKHIEIPSMSDNNWKGYSTTISMLKNGLSTGIVFDNSSSSLQHFDYNTEEWLTLKSKTYLKIAENDPKAQCWIYELSKIGTLDKATCDLLIHNGLEFCYLYQTFDKDEFLHYYESYWHNDSFYEKHLSVNYIKSSSDYIFLGFMYAIMGMGIYHINSHQKQEVNINDEDCDTLSKGLFSCTIECLYRGRYLQHPSIYSLQIILIVKQLAGFLGGNVLSNNLTCISFFLIYKLDLKKQKDILSSNTLWVFLQNDWYDNHDRYQITNVMDYSNLALPTKWIGNDDKLINWNNFFLLFSIEISKIKNKYYYEDKSITIESLRKADVELRLLEVEYFRDLDSFSIKDYPETHVDQIMCLKVHLISNIYNEILEVNSKMAVFLESQEWFQYCYYPCFYSATEVVDMFLADKYKKQFKVYPSVIDHVISASVFLLVDCLLKEGVYSKRKKLLRKIRNVFIEFTNFECTITGAIRGTFVMKKLLELIETKYNSKPFEFNNFGTNTKMDSNNYTFANTPTNYNSNLDISDIEYRSDSTNENVEYGENEGDDEDGDEEMPLYYSTLPPQGVDGLIDETIHPAKITAATTPVTFEEYLDSSSKQQSNIHNKIMDILEDPGWSKFITSLDDLNMPQTL